MKKILLSIIASVGLFASPASAQNQVLVIEYTDGTTQTIAVSDIKRMSFDTEEPSLAGTYQGDIKIVIGGAYSYDCKSTYEIAVNADGTLDVTMNTYQIDGTVMGDLTLGTLTVKGLTLDAQTGVYSKDYGSEGLKRHLTAKQNGTTTMDKDYDITAGSTVTVQSTANGVVVTDSFRLGSMPFPIVSTFTAH